MQHEPTATPPAPASLDGIDNRSLVIIGLFGVILTYVLMVGVQVLSYRMEKADFMRKVVGPGCQDLKEARAGWHAQLDHYRWVDPQHQAAVLPIDQSMRQVVADLAGQRH